MSRHRNVKQLVDDDYYDGYDDDDDYYDDYDDGYTGGSSNMQAKKKPPVAAKKPSKVSAGGAAAQLKTPSKASTNPKNSSTAPLQPKKINPPTAARSSTSIASQTHTSSTTNLKSGSRSDSASFNNLAAAPSPLPLILQSTTSNSAFLPPLTVVILGHVDAGKSTVTGHLLHGAATNHRNQSNRKQPINYAWILDEDEQERAHGVTIDIATKVLELDPTIPYLSSTLPNTLWTPPHPVSIVLQDAPGHADYVPAMITGAAVADAALLIVDATDLQHTALQAGQLREHVWLARGLGVNQIIIVINKMDVVGWDQADAYRRIERELIDFCTRTVGYPSSRVRCLPVSGLVGTNIFPPMRTTSIRPAVANATGDSAAILRSWYTGPTLLEALYSFEPSVQQQKLLENPLRILVSDVLDSSGSVKLRVKVVAGWVKMGETLIVMPVGDEAVLSKFTSLHTSTTPTHRGIEASDVSKEESARTNERRLYGVAGELLDCSMSGLDVQRVSPGSILVRSDKRPVLATQCRAKIFVLDGLTVPLIRGAQLVFHMHHLDVPCYCSALIRTIQAATDSDTSPTIRERPRALTQNSTAVVELQLAVPVCMESFADCRALGRFVLRRSGDSIAVGRIEQVLF